MATKKKPEAYIGGPMTNIPNFNFDVFDAVEEAASYDYTPINPHRHDQEIYPGIDDAEATKTGDVQALAAEIGFSFEGAMKWDLTQVIRAPYMILLPGWERSTGARDERLVAEATGSTILLACAVCEPGDPIEDAYAWVLEPDEDQKRLTSYLAEYGTYAVGPLMEYAMAKATPRELMNELKARLGHISVFRENINKMEANLA